MNDQWMADMELLRVSETEAAVFEQYYQMLVDWNERLNLTAIVERNDVYVKHFWDSLAVRDLPEWQMMARVGAMVADIGTGAGFPGIPLAIVHPQLKFTLFDSLAKRLAFLEQVVADLGLKNVTLVHQRAEDSGRDVRYRNRFDLVLSRAVAKLNVLCEFTCPLAKPGGYVVAYKGPGVSEELVDGRRAAGQLGASVSKTLEVTLPQGHGDRVFVVIAQQSLTAKSFPRRAGIPQKQPL